jgi:hypothetical protein
MKRTSTAATTMLAEIRAVCGADNLSFSQGEPLAASAPLPPWPKSKTGQECPRPGQAEAPHASPGQSPSATPKPQEPAASPALPEPEALTPVILPLPAPTMTPAAPETSK